MNNAASSSAFRITRCSTTSRIFYNRSDSLDHYHDGTPPRPSFRRFRCPKSSYTSLIVHVFVFQRSALSLLTELKTISRLLLQRVRENVYHRCEISLHLHSARLLLKWTSRYSLRWTPSLEFRMSWELCVCRQDILNSTILFSSLTLGLGSSLAISLRWPHSLL